VATTPTDTQQRSGRASPASRRRPRVVLHGGSRHDGRPIAANAGRDQKIIVYPLRAKEEPDRAVLEPVSTRQVECLAHIEMGGRTTRRQCSRLGEWPTASVLLCATRRVEPQLAELCAQLRALRRAPPREVLHLVAPAMRSGAQTWLTNSSLTVPEMADHGDVSNDGQIHSALETGEYEQPLPPGPNLVT